MPSTRSDPGSTNRCVHPTAVNNIDANDDMYMTAAASSDGPIFSFRNCSSPSCGNTSAFAEWDCMTLRCGFDTCTAHTTMDAVRNRTESLHPSPKSVVIFYDIEITSTREIEQVSAVATNGNHFDTYIKTTVRRHNSPMLGQIPPMLYTLTAVEPKTAMDHLIFWVAKMRQEIGGSSESDENVVMVAHGGSKHDHVLILKAMMKWGINPPRWRFADTLPLFKIVLCPNEKASLVELVDRYAPWFDHTPHDALSDAKGLMSVVRATIAGAPELLYAFSSDYETFTTSVGLNAFKIRKMIPFPSSSGTRA